MRPCAAMLAANSSSPRSAPVLRTLAGEGLSLLSGISITAAATLAFVSISISSALRQCRPIRRWRIRRRLEGVLREERGAPWEGGLTWVRRASPQRAAAMRKSFEKELFGHGVRLRAVREMDHAHKEACGEPRQQLPGRFPAGPISIEEKRQHSNARFFKKRLLLG